MSKIRRISKYRQMAAAHRRALRMAAIWGNEGRDFKGFGK